MTGVHAALSTLLPVEDAHEEASTSNQASEPRIQHISFPAAQSNRGQQEKFRGFAFVVLRDEALARRFVEKWPWERRQETLPDQSGSASRDSYSASEDDEDELGSTTGSLMRKGGAGPSATERAKQHGFRTLSKYAKTFPLVVNSRS
jgi:hypothetical protein